MKWYRFSLNVFLILGGVFVYKATQPVLYEHDIDWIDTPKVTIKEEDRVCYIFNLDVSKRYYHERKESVYLCRRYFGEE